MRHELDLGSSDEHLEYLHRKMAAPNRDGCATSMRTWPSSVFADSSRCGCGGVVVGRRGRDCAFGLRTVPDIGIRGNADAGYPGHRSDCGIVMFL